MSRSSRIALRRFINPEMARLSSRATELEQRNPMTDLPLIRPHTAKCFSNLTNDREIYACNCGAYTPLTEKDVRQIIREEIAKAKKSTR